MNGKKFKQARERLGHTQESLAELIGFHPRNITRYENGDAQPNADTLYRIALALNVSVDYLLDLTDDPTPIRAGANLSQRETAIINAIRRGDKMEALKVIITDKD